MDKNQERMLQELAEQFVRKVLTETFNQKVSESEIKLIAQKVMHAVHGGKGCVDWSKMPKAQFDWLVGNNII